MGMWNKKKAEESMWTFTCKLVSLSETYTMYVCRHTYVHLQLRWSDSWKSKRYFENRVKILQYPVNSRKWVYFVLKFIHMYISLPERTGKEKQAAE